MGRRRRSCIIRLFIYKCKNSPECDEREESKDTAGSKSKKKSNIGKSRSDDDEESCGNSSKTVAMQKRWKPELESIVEDKLLITALVDDGDEVEEFPSPSHHLFLTSKKAMAYNHPTALPWKAPTKRPSSTHYNKINWMYPRLFPLHSACPLGIIF